MNDKDHCREDGKLNSRRAVDATDETYHSKE